jgi:hypothetical protein
MFISLIGLEAVMFVMLMCVLIISWVCGGASWFSVVITCVATYKWTSQLILLVTEAYLSRNMIAFSLFLRVTCFFYIFFSVNPIYIQETLVILIVVSKAVVSNLLECVKNSFLHSILELFVFKLRLSATISPFILFSLFINAFLLVLFLMLWFVNIW